MKKQYILVFSFLFSVFIICVFFFFYSDGQSQLNDKQPESNNGQLDLNGDHSELNGRFIEQDFNTLIKYPINSTTKMTFGTYLNINKKYEAFVDNGILFIQDADTQKSKKIELLPERILKFNLTQGCGMVGNYGNQLYFLTDQNNVYQLDFTNNTPLDSQVIKVYDGINLTQNENVDLVTLLNQNGFVTCMTKSVYLKVNDEVYSFSGEKYTNLVQTRNVYLLNGKMLHYSLDGFLSIKTLKDEENYIINANGEKIQFILMGTCEGQGYLLDNEGNEYIFHQTVLDYFENLEVFELKPTNKKEIFKISKKDDTYFVEFTDHVSRIVESEPYNNIFSEIK